ncbi:MAG: sulfurtransferase [Pseudolabrys sp.]
MANRFAALVARQFRRAVAAAVLSAAIATPALAAEPLVSVDWLKAHRADAGVVVLDIRSAIDGGGKDAFVKAHIPGAVHTDYDKSGWRVERKGVPFMLPTVAELEKLIGELGIDEDSHVVVVPAGVSHTDFGSAARVYWTLKTVGVNKVSILDGGFAAWTGAGQPVAQGAVVPSPKIFTATFSDKSLANDERVLASSGIKEAKVAASVVGSAKAAASPGVTLIDARPESYFLGKEKAPNAAAYGHIPGAVNLDSAAFYDAATNRLKPRAELAALAAQIPDGPAIAYCNTGHWAATDWFVLHELLGRKEVRLYDGSMVEWTSHRDRPVASSRTKWDDLKRALGLGS